MEKHLSIAPGSNGLTDGGWGLNRNPRLQLGRRRRRALPPPSLLCWMPKHVTSSCCWSTIEVRTIEHQQLQHGLSDQIR